MLFRSDASATGDAEDLDTIIPSGEDEEEEEETGERIDESESEAAPAAIE